MNTKYPGERHPDFEPGNRASVRSGVYSSAMIDELAAEVRETLLEVAPWIDRIEYMPAVARYLRVEARALLAHDWIEHVTATAGFGKVSTRLLEVANQTDRLAAQCGESLGLDPFGRARLAAVMASAAANGETLADLIAAGRQTAAAQVTP